MWKFPGKKFKLFVQENNDVMIVRSRCFGKITKCPVKKGYGYQFRIVEDSISLIYLRLISKLLGYAITKCGQGLSLPNVNTKNTTQFK